MTEEQFETALRIRYLELLDLFNFRALNLASSTEELGILHKRLEAIEASLPPTHIEIIASEKVSEWANSKLNLDVGG